MKRNEKGQVLVLVALAIFVLLGFAALGIDLGYTWSVRHELQRCADAGALAGASAFRQYGKDSSDTSFVDGSKTTKQIAEERALDYATRDNVSTSPLTTVAGDNVIVTFPTTPNLLRVRVEVQRIAPLFFGRVLGWKNTPIKAFAVAEAFSTSHNVKCVVPWGIPAPWVDTNANGVYDVGEKINLPEVTNCDDEVTVTTKITGWDYATHTSTYEGVAGARSPRDNFLCRGSLQVLKIGKPGDQMNPGNFLGLDLSGMGCGGNPGANFYYWMITHSCECGINLGVDDMLTTDTKTGNMVQNTITAVAPVGYYIDPDGPGSLNPYLPSGWKNDNASLMNQDPKAVWVDDNAGGYPADGTGTKIEGIGDNRIVRLPIYSPEATMDSTGKFTFKALGFVGFWIQDVVYTPPNNGTVVGRFISVEGTGTADEDSAGYTVLNIRLVE